MRAFIALDLPEAFLTPLARLQAGLTVGRPVPEENLHLTLAFLGDMSEPQARDVAEALAELRHPPVELELKGLDLFGGRRPNVLFAQAAGAGLENLHEKVAHLVRAAGIALPRERFRPHVTLARFPREMSAKDQARLGEFLTLNSPFALPADSADTVTLYRSHLREDGAIYDPLAEVELKS